jgi:glycosyltransferase involved in cell wall biosynthesis
MAVAFSVVVTCCNYRDFVAEAVDGALAQTRAAAQVIVVDDGSTDGSTEYLTQRYGGDPRVTLLCGPNGGQLAAFQRGAAAARGDVLCFLDADDRWAPDYLARIGALYDARPDVDFVFTDLRLFGQEQRLLAFAGQPVDLGYTAVVTYATAHWYGAPTSALSLRRSLALRCLDLDGDWLAAWRLCADNCLVLGASVLGGRKMFLPTGSVHYRVHAANGWWNRITPTSDYLSRLRSRGLIEHYARRCGLSAQCLELARAEFLTRPAPTWKEARRYARVALRAEGPWLRNCRRALSILLRRGWRGRS